MVSYNWEENLKDDPAQLSASNMHTILLNLVERCCPLRKQMVRKTVKISKRSQELVKLGHELDALAIRVKVIKDDRLYEVYKNMKRL
ncbi:hypothetical protein HHI36_015835 [Cryptolaemus montrouzieri]|uniref:Uncharacterized protein n=1 Tax=Cryptolaemus montrouzieri TaxID=559131 RepID=A0ABD2N799_9CUCU